MQMVTGYDANQPDDGQLLIWGDRSDNVGGISLDLSHSIGTQAPILSSSLMEAELVSKW